MSVSMVYYWVQTCLQLVVKLHLLLQSIIASVSVIVYSVRSEVTAVRYIYSFIQRKQMNSILQKFSNKVLLLSLCFLLYASSMDSFPWTRSIYNNKAGHRLTFPLQLLWQALALEAVHMPASIHLHWNNPAWMILGLQLCREHTLTL